VSDLAVAVEVAGRRNCQPLGRQAWVVAVAVAVVAGRTTLLPQPQQLPLQDPRLRNFVTKNLFFLPFFCKITNQVR
jgi:hypothetical protein